MAFRTVLAVLLGFALTRALIAATDALFGVKTPGTGYFALSFAMDTIACLLGMYPPAIWFGAMLRKKLTA